MIREQRIPGAYYGRRKDRAKWLEVSTVMGEAGCSDTVDGRARFMVRAEERAAEETPGRAKERYKELRRGWYIGSDEFKERLLEKLEQGGREIRDRSGNLQMRRDHGEERARKIVSCGLKVFKLDEGGLQGLAKSDGRKAAIGHVARRETTVSLDWVSKRLAMGDRCAVSRLCRRADERLVKRLSRKLKHL